MKGPHLDLTSTQKEGFQGKQGDKIEKSKPEDLLHSSGSITQLTSYKLHFPGFTGYNQYVKPTDRYTRA